MDSRTNGRLLLWFGFSLSIMFFLSCGTSIYRCELKTVPQKFLKHVQLAERAARELIREHNEAVEGGSKPDKMRYDFEKYHIFITPFNEPQRERPYVEIEFVTYDNFSNPRRDENIDALVFRIYEDGWSIKRVH